MALPDRADIRQGNQGKPVLLQDPDSDFMTNFPPTASGEPLFFTGSTGARLSTVLDEPTHRPTLAWALFAHCFTGSKALPAMREIARALTAEGIGVLRFDFTGLGESEGDFSRTNLSTNADDLVEAAAWLWANRAAPEILVGHSLGGAAVLQAAGRIPEVSAVATIGAPAEPEHVFRIIRDDLEAASMRETIAGLDLPLLVFHSPLDRTVGIENAARIFEAARHPKSFVALDDADHLLTRPRDARYVGVVLAVWAHRYIDLLELDHQEHVE